MLQEKRPRSKGQVVSVKLRTLAQAFSEGWEVGWAGVRNLTDIYEQAFVKWMQAERGGSKHLFGITRRRATGLIAKASLIHYHGVIRPSPFNRGLASLVRVRLTYLL